MTEKLQYDLSFSLGYLSFSHIKSFLLLSGLRNRTSTSLPSSKPAFYLHDTDLFLSLLWAKGEISVSHAFFPQLLSFLWVFTLGAPYIFGVTFHPGHCLVSSSFLLYSLISLGVTF